MLDLIEYLYTLPKKMKELDTRIESLGWEDVE
jgi:hypothetical protein